MSWDCYDELGTQADYLGTIASTAREALAGGFENPADALRQILNSAEAAIASMAEFDGQGIF